MNTDKDMQAICNHLMKEIFWNPPPEVLRKFRPQARQARDDSGEEGDRPAKPTSIEMYTMKKHLTNIMPTEFLKDHNLSEMKR